MRARIVPILVVFLVSSNLLTVQAQQRRPMQIEDLFKFKRISDPQISPDGKSVVYTLGDVSLEQNKIISTLWLAPTANGEPRQLQTQTKNASHARWSPDGTKILFLSSQSGSSQIWIMDPHGNGKARQLTDIATGVDDAIWSPDGKYIAFVSAVWPEFSKHPFAKSNALNKERMEEREKSPVKARVYTRLFFRHWDSYVEDKRLHLFVVSSSGGESKDVTPWDRDASPTSFTFASARNYTFTPDSQYLVFTATPEKDEAWSTNYDICKVSIAGGEIECLTSGNAAADGGPQFSPDGQWLAYRAQAVPGSEADRWQIMLMPADGKGKPKSVTPDFDAWPDDLVWSADSKTIYFTAEKEARTPIWSVSIDDGKVSKVIDKHTNGSLSLSRDGKTIAFTRVAMTFPPEVFVSNLEGEERCVSRANEKLLAQLDLPRPESVIVKGAGGTPMQMWILKPPGFDPSKKWPLVYLVHGGPQGAWTDSWSFRWNPEVWAAQGYVIALPNPRGSSGFGQQYCNEITGDWGGKCYEDLMAGVDYMESLPYIDKDRMAAAGASFGGYMMNWFQGHTDRFKTLISHAGVYNFDSMWATTEELWFDEWEHGGKPWDKSKSYTEFSPHLYVKNFKTPMLIIHGDLDFRVPVSEGLQLFTTLQRLGIPSRMINFTDEGHWVSKPRNSEFWHREVFAWLKKYVPPGGR